MIPDLADEPFCVAKYADVMVSRSLNNKLSLAQQDFDKEAFEDTIRQAFACPETFISFMLHL